MTFDSSRVSSADLLSTIRGLDYEPELVTAPVERVVAAERIDPTSLPEDLQALFAQAQAKDKPVLIEFSGPG